jgi:hypothetical protein
MKLLTKYSPDLKHQPMKMLIRLCFRQTSRMFLNNKYEMEIIQQQKNKNSLLHVFFYTQTQRRPINSVADEENSVSRALKLLEWVSLNFKKNRWLVEMYKFSLLTFK